jgi:hypothetical protein
MPTRSHRDLCPAIRDENRRILFLGAILIARSDQRRDDVFECWRERRARRGIKPRQQPLEFAGERGGRKIFDRQHVRWHREGKRAARRRWQGHKRHAWDGDGVETERGVGLLQRASCLRPGLEPQRLR